MPQPTPDFPFAHRLPSDVAARIHATPAVDIPLVETGPPRRRPVVPGGRRGRHRDENRLC